MRENGMWQETEWETALGGRGEARPHRQATRWRADRRARCAEIDAGRAASARAHRARPRQRATSIIACAAPISATRRAIRCTRRSAARSRSWSRRRACWSSARTCARKCRCSRIACARRRCGAAKIRFINPQRYEYLFPVAGYLASNGSACSSIWLRSLLRRATRAARVRRRRLPRWSRSAQPTDAHKRLLNSWRRRATIDPARRDRATRSGVRRSASGRERAGRAHGRDARLSAEGGNAVGARLAGVLPHRAVGGVRRDAGLERRRHVCRAAQGYILFGGIEPQLDIASSAALRRAARRRSASSHCRLTRRRRSSRTSCCRSARSPKLPAPT